MPTERLREIPAESLARDRLTTSREWAAHRG